METTLKYTVIKDRKQYVGYVSTMDEFLDMDTLTDDQEEELDLLSVLIDDYERNNSTIKVRSMNPIALIKSLMEDHKLNNNDIADIMGISKNYASEILNYKKRLTLDHVKKLSNRFKLNHEAFAKEYQLKNNSPVTKSYRSSTRERINRVIRARKTGKINISPRHVKAASKKK